MMRILITGATGFLGNNVVRALLRDNHEIAVTLRASSNRSTLDGLNVEPVLVDLNHFSDIGLAVKDADVVIHSAAMIQIGWSKLAASRRVNVEATAGIAEACRRKKVRMIYVSSVDALGAATETEIGDETKLDPPKPACSYVVSKREAESAVILEVAKGLDGVIVNPGFMVGPYDWKPSSGEMMFAIHKNAFLPFAPAGGCSVADVRDVAEGIVSAIEHGQTGNRYILGGQNMSYLELWTRMAEVIGKRPPKRALPEWIAQLAGKAGDFAGKFSKSEPQVNSAATQMGQMFHYYSSEKAKTELGYKIGSVDDALRDAWDWFKAMKMV
jgi:dihydroflavonol-4-reductase